MNGWGGQPGRMDRLGRMVILESSNRMTQALSRLRRFETWSWQDYDEFITTAVWEENKARYFYGMARKAREKGLASPARILNLDVELRLALSTSFHVVDHASGLTGLGSMVFDVEDGHRSWKLYNPNLLTANYQKRGQFGYINGIPGSGKTNTACVISEYYVRRPNRVAIGNIKMKTPDSRFVFAPDGKTLLRTIANLPYTTEWLFTLDEGGLNYGKPDQSTSRVKDLDKFARVIRKLGGSFNLVEQRPESVPNIITEFARNVFYCERRGVVYIDLRGPYRRFRDTVRGFPKTTLPFDTDDIAMFELKINVERMFDALTNSDDPKRDLRRFLGVGS